jgi:hypothetical protein
MLLKQSVLNWYHSHVAYSLELIVTFVEGIEKQAEESILKYEKGKQSVVVEDEVGEHEEEYPRRVETYQGLDSETWALATIFGEYFPSLQRRSALLTVCGYFENELNKLCSLYQSEKAIGLALSDLKGNGINRSTNYLEKVVGLNTQKSSQEWKRIKAIQKIRNLIAHQDARLAETPDKDLLSVIHGMPDMVSLTDRNEIVIEAGFLSHVVDTYQNYFRMLNESIKTKEKA